MGVGRGRLVLRGPTHCSKQLIASHRAISQVTMYHLALMQAQSLLLKPSEPVILRCSLVHH